MSRIYKRKTLHKRAPSTAFKPGDPRINRKGRKPGVPNKFTGELKALILNGLASAHKDGAPGWIKKLATKNPRAFASLLSRLLPTKIGNEDEKPFQVEQITNAQAGLAKLSDAQLKQLRQLYTVMGIIKP